MNQLVITALSLFSSIAAAGASCTELASLALPHTKILTAAAITTGEFLPPGAAKPITGIPPFCRVSGSVHPSPDSDIRFEVWLPLEKWNRKFQGIGNGGYAGNIGFGSLASAVRLGYAAASTDTGHPASSGIDASWALNHPEKIIDYGWRGIHEMTVQGKAITKAFYGEAPAKSYFSSCSNGGRQALMEAQRFPDDYDGIIAGAPANYFTRLLSLMAMMMQAADKAYIPAAKLKAIQSVAITSCDARDGVTDGVLENPPSCKPDYASLLCKGPETDACLTAPQLDTLKAMTSGLRDRKGKLLYPALSPSGESEGGGWAAWITGAKSESSASYGFATQFFKNMVYSDPQWTLSKFDVERDTKLADSKLGPILNSTDPDLSRFHARGGKLILYHGWCDAAIPAQNAIDYYRSVEKRLGAKKTGAFVRLFMAPGVQHCAGGPGPDQFGQGGPSANADPVRHMNAALERWVEQGVAPDRVIAARMKAGKPERTRPLCAYPLVARYNGSGSTDDAANFTCAK